MIQVFYSLGSDGLGEEESTGIKNHDRLDDKQIEETFNKVSIYLFIILSYYQSTSCYISIHLLFDYLINHLFFQLFNFIVFLAIYLFVLIFGKLYVHQSLIELIYLSIYQHLYIPIYLDVCVPCYNSKLCFSLCLYKSIYLSSLYLFSCLFTLV